MAKEGLIIRTFNDVVTELRTVASEIGGGHLSNKEAEQRIKTIANVATDLIWGTAEMLSDTAKKVFGISEEALEIYKREKNMQERECKKCAHYINDGTVKSCTLWECNFKKRGEEE